MDQNETQDSTVKNQDDQELVKNFDSENFSFSPKMIAILLVLVLLGIGGGYLASGSSSKSSSKNSPTSSSQVSSGTILGSNDTSTFKDTVEGTLKKGGIQGEGQYHLERPGGDSQNVYLTSSTVDLALILDKKVKVWGQTQTAQHAGWLMDVGRVEVK